VATNARDLKQLALRASAGAGGMSTTPASDPAPSSTAIGRRAAMARRLLRGARRAALATLDAATGGPYASLVTLATAPDASPLLLLSDLSQHSRNLAADARASLLVEGPPAEADPLTGPRISVVGTIVKAESAASRARFLARQPQAFYAAFGDFVLYRMTLARAHLVAGFAEAHWIEPADLVLADTGPLAEAEPAILGHMNADHADAVALLATTLLGAEPAGWRMIGIDREGADLARSEGGSVLRLDFDREVATAQEARAVLVDLAARARAGLRT
jgi:hypothetical protein